MSPLLKEVVPIAAAIECLAGVAFAQVACMWPDRVPARLRRWVPPLPERGARQAGALFLQSLAWLLATAAAAALCVPLLPAYTAFRWHDAGYRAWEALTGWRAARNRGQA